VDNKQLAKEFLEYRNAKGPKNLGVNECDSCGKNRILQPSYGKRVCSSCLTTRITIKHRPKVALNSFREFHGSLSPWLIEEEKQAIVNFDMGKIINLISLCEDHVSERISISTDYFSELKKEAGFK